jgi:hypothetical protein
MKQKENQMYKCNCERCKPTEEGAETSMMAKGCGYLLTITMAVVYGYMMFIAFAIIIGMFSCTAEASDWSNNDVTITHAYCVEGYFQEAYTDVLIRWDPEAVYRTLVLRCMQLPNVEIYWDGPRGREHWASVPISAGQWVIGTSRSRDQRPPAQPVGGYNWWEHITVYVNGAQLTVHHASVSCDPMPVPQGSAWVYDYGWTLKKVVVKGND